MKRRIMIVVVAVGGGLLCGAFYCTASWLIRLYKVEREQVTVVGINAYSFQRVEKGMTAMEVEEVLGGPSRTERSDITSRLDGMAIAADVRVWSNMRGDIIQVFFDDNERVVGKNSSVHDVSSFTNPMAMFQDFIRVAAVASGVLLGVIAVYQKRSWLRL